MGSRNYERLLSQVRLKAPVHQTACGSSGNPVPWPLMQFKIGIVSLGLSFAAGSWAQSTGSWGAVQRMDSCGVKVERFGGCLVTLTR